MIGSSCCALPPKSETRLLSRLEVSRRSCLLLSAVSPGRYQSQFLLTEISCCSHKRVSTLKLRSKLITGLEGIVIGVEFLHKRILIQPILTSKIPYIIITEVLLRIESENLSRLMLCLESRLIPLLELALVETDVEIFCAIVCVAWFIFDDASLNALVLDI